MTIDQRRRVVITGVGAITPVGKTAPETYQAYLEGRSGIGPITSFDTDRFTTKIAGKVNFDPVDYFDKQEIKRLGRLAQLGVIAGREAFAQAGLETIPKALQHRTAAIMGVGVVDFETVEDQLKVLFEKGPRSVSPVAVLMFEPDSVTGELCRRFGIQGVSYTLNSACASGLDALVNAYKEIANGEMDIVITGGVGAEVTPFGLATFGRMRALSTDNDDPAGASRPFSKGRNGFVLGEGAVVFVLEWLESAQRRGAKILAEIVGYGQCTDTYHETAPDEEGSAAIWAMRVALQRAQMLPRDVELISVHGTSTDKNDKTEARAIRAVFGTGPNAPLVNATKSFTGHLIGAAGPECLLSVVYAIRTGLIHPTRNLLTPDVECELNHVIGTPLRREINAGMADALGFQGHNTALIAKCFVL